MGRLASGGNAGCSVDFWFVLWIFAFAGFILTAISRVVSASINPLLRPPLRGRFFMRKGNSNLRIWRFSQAL